MLRSASRPIAFEPCIPTSSDRPPSGPGWVHEIKHDGFRLIARRDEAGVRLITRNGHDFSGRYPGVAATVDRLPCRSCIIDGEVVIVDEEGRALFDRLQEGPRSKPDAVLFAFDIIELDGTDMRQMPLLTRKSRLLTLIQGAPAGIVFNEHMDPEALARAREKIAGSELEVWQGARLVGRIDEVPPIGKDAPPKRG
jgi:bifunctional non-homologous end joining protein LigD